MKTPRRQSGAALLAAVFLITVLAAAGGLTARLVSTGTQTTLSEWFSSQALHAAESGIDWTVYNGGANAVNQQVTANSWFTTNTVATALGGGHTLYVSTITGSAGGTAANPRVERQITVRWFQ